MLVKQRADHAHRLDIQVEFELSNSTTQNLTLTFNTPSDELRTLRPLQDSSRLFTSISLSWSY